MAQFEFADFVDEYQLPFTIFDTTDGSYNDAGKWIKGAETPRDMTGIILPLSNDELKNEANGTYTTMDRKIIVKEPLKIGQRMEYEGVNYLIDSAKLYPYADIYVYFAKGVK